MKCRCATCGYLLAEKQYVEFNKPHDHEADLAEVVGAMRSSEAKGAWNFYNPACFRQETIAADDCKADERFQAIHGERFCKSYRIYFHGMSPKEHLEMELSEKQHKEVMDHGSRVSLVSAAIGFFAAVIGGAMGLLAPFIQKLLEKIIE